MELINSPLLRFIFTTYCMRNNQWMSQLNFQQLLTTSTNVDMKQNLMLFNPEVSVKNCYKNEYEDIKSTLDILQPFISMICTILAASHMNILMDQIPFTIALNGLRRYILETNSMKVVIQALVHVLYCQDFRNDQFVLKCIAEVIIEVCVDTPYLDISQFDITSSISWLESLVEYSLCLRQTKNRSSIQIGLLWVTYIFEQIEKRWRQKLSNTAKVLQEHLLNIEVPNDLNSVLNWILKVAEMYENKVAVSMKV